ncbi:MAG: C39 family peptidase [Bacteroidales bacterium]|nr:C39 family peptidase [Bacteroidales bacterium]
MRTLRTINCLFVFMLSLALLSCNKDKEELSLLDQFSNMSEEELAYAREHWLVATAPYANTYEHPNSFIITNNPKPDTQGEYECAGCSSAYLLRFYGETANGVELYHQPDFPCKFAEGAYPKCFKILFEEQYKNYTTEYYTGSTDDLKNAVSKGIPVIVLMLYNGKSLHYVPVVGYDETHFYIQDSVEEFRNAENENYNEKLDINLFDDMWNIPLESCQRLFVIVKGK